MLLLRSVSDSEDTQTSRTFEVESDGQNLFILKFSNFHFSAVQIHSREKERYFIGLENLGLPHFTIFREQAEGRVPKSKQTDLGLQDRGMTRQCFRG